MSEPVRTGVIGVGAMGQHHARVYNELQDAELVGVADENRDRAREIAREYGTDVYSMAELVQRAEAVSIAVPTQYHHEVALSCIEAGTDVLVEKPFTETVEEARDLIATADEAGVTLQVGHVERFNPVTETLQDIVPGLDVISVAAERLGPGPNRPIKDSVVTDLMIHDLDIIDALVDGEIEEIAASGNAEGRHATATVEFGNGVVGSLTASRVTQRKVRELRITARECFVIVDYTDQSVEIHRQSRPEYITDDGDVRFRHESIIENPVVENAEPLKEELAAFVGAVRTGAEPRVTGQDGLQSLVLAREINEAAFGKPDKQVEVMLD